VGRRPLRGFGRKRPALSDYSRLHAFGRQHTVPWYGIPVGKFPTSERYPGTVSY